MKVDGQNYKQQVELRNNNKIVSSVKEVTQAENPETIQPQG